MKTWLRSLANISKASEKYNGIVSQEHGRVAIEFMYRLIISLIFYTENLLDAKEYKYSVDIL